MCGKSQAASPHSPRTCWSGPSATATRLRRGMEAMLHERFGLDHTTLQVDHVGAELLDIELPAPQGGVG